MEVVGCCGEEGGGGDDVKGKRGKKGGVEGGEGRGLKRGNREEALEVCVCVCAVL